MIRKKTVFWAACAGILLFGIGLITLGSAGPDLKAKFNLDELAAGTLFSILPLGILLGSLLFGPICDKYGYKLLLSVSCLFMCIGFQGLAYAPGLGLMKVCIFFFGIGAGAINGATNAVVSDISDSDKGANLSILGFFFGVGALGMPVVLGLLRNSFSVEAILSTVGIYAAVIGIIFLFVRFPAPKQHKGLPLKETLSLIKDRVLILIAFFLFLQSSFEAIINNWTALLLVDKLNIGIATALYSLSLFVGGLTAMRLLLGSVFRNTGQNKLIYGSFLLILSGLILLKAGTTLTTANIGLVLTGAGLSAGFPIMLGIVGSRYNHLSGTAFSFVLAIALTGNMLVNYLVGILARSSGIEQVINVALVELAAMIVLYSIIHITIKNSSKI